jgi:hypothetical protein
MPKKSRGKAFESKSIIYKCYLSCVAILFALRAHLTVCHTIDHKSIRYVLNIASISCALTSPCPANLNASNDKRIHIYASSYYARARTFVACRKKRIRVVTHIMFSPSLERIHWEMRKRIERERDTHTHRNSPMYSNISSFSTGLPTYTCMYMASRTDNSKALLVHPRIAGHSLH